MGVQKERMSAFLTAFEHREKEDWSLFAAQYWYRSCLRMSLLSESSVSISSNLLIFLSIDFQQLLIFLFPCWGIIKCLNASTLTTAAFELVQHFYHAA